MKVLKSLEEVESAGLSPPVYAAAHGVLKNLIDAYAKHGETYDPEDDGYVRSPEDAVCITDASTTCHCKVAQKGNIP